MDVAFVIGLALEIAGAALLATEVISRDPRHIRRRGVMVIGPDVPARAAQRSSARGIVGFGLLGLGFVVQSFVYAIDGGLWLLLLAVAVVASAFAIAGRVADGPITTWLWLKALAYDKALEE